jgi:GNAT superfamily N-acetyltransferase
VVRVEVVDQALTRELRRSVLRPNLPPGAPLPGDELANAVHLGAVGDDGTVLCTCFIYPDAPPWQPGREGGWHLRQMATHPEHRGRGLGALVLEAAVRQARECGGGLLWCNARESAIGFYLRQGFRPHGAVFVEHEIPHQRLWLELGGAPTSSVQVEAGGDA